MVAAVQIRAEGINGTATRGNFCKGHIITCIIVR